MDALRKYMRSELKKKYVSAKSLKRSDTEDQRLSLVSNNHSDELEAARRSPGVSLEDIESMVCFADFDESLIEAISGNERLESVRENNSTDMY